MIGTIESIGAVDLAVSNSRVHMASVDNDTINRGSTFGQLISDKVSDINEKIISADKAIVSYIAGDDVPVHELMISIGKAKSQLELAVEVRNRLLESYREIARMQI